MELQLERPERELELGPAPAAPEFATRQEWMTAAMASSDEMERTKSSMLSPVRGLDYSRAWLT
jgi:hypothetical protein